MKRRIFALALSVLMLCSLLAGCGPKGAYETIEAAVKKTQTLNEMSVKTEMHMTISNDSMSITMPIALDVKAKDINGSNPIILTELTMNMLGQQLVALVYQEDGWSYTVIGDDKAKTKAAPQTDQYDYSEEMLQVIPKELLKDVKLEKGSDGAATATITIPGEKFMTVYSDLVDSVSSNMSSGEDLTVKDAQVVISVLDGYISAYNMTFRMEATDGENVSAVDVDASITYENPGKPVEITPPEGYKDFQER